MTEATKKCKKKRNRLLAAQLGVMLATCVVLIVCIIARLGFNAGGGTDETIQQKFGTVLCSLGVTLSITCAMLIVVGHKVRATIWMICMLMAAYLFSTNGMWCVLAVWGIDEYILYPLYKHSETSLVANKEIDKRL